MGRELQKQPQQEMASAVEQLLAVNPYNPDILPDLENYVNEQVTFYLYRLFSVQFVLINCYHLLDYVLICNRTSDWEKKKILILR